MLFECVFVISLQNTGYIYIYIYIYEESSQSERCIGVRCSLALLLRYSRPHQTWKRFRFQRTDRSTGRIYLRRTRPIVHIVLFRSRQQINRLSELSVSKKTNKTVQLRKRGNKSQRPETGFSTYKVCNITILIYKNVFQK